MTSMTSMTSKISKKITSPLQCKLSQHLKKYILINNAKQDLETLAANWVDQYKHLSGGQMRQLRGYSIEQFVINTINTIGVCVGSGGKTLRAIKGDLDKKALTINDIHQQHQVDVHVYSDDKFVATVECKAYLDKCYYIRACDDFDLFRKFGYDVKHYIFSFENSIADNAKIFTDFVKDDICDDVFYMVDGKRNSAKPLYIEQHVKKINQTNLIKFINQMYELTR